MQILVLDDQGRPGEVVGESVLLDLEPAAQRFTIGISLVLGPNWRSDLVIGKKWIGTDLMYSM